MDNLITTMWSFSLTVNQVDNSGKIEFQEFKVFWEKMKKWIVGVGSCVVYEHVLSNCT